jgi:FtsP/CotA-like multicopper oxidase with cupredoxin domain
MGYPDRVAAGGMGPGMMTAGIAGNTETFPIIELRAAQLETTDLSLPEQLIRLPNWTAAQATRTRTFTLDMPMMGMGGMMGDPRMEGIMGINGRSMNRGRVDERVSLGSVEIWEIRNTTPLAHPFHIHGVQFRTLDHNGKPPAPHERGLKDTVLVDPGSTARVIMEFADFANQSFHTSITVIFLSTRTRE